MLLTWESLSNQPIHAAYERLTSDLQRQTHAGMEKVFLQRKWQDGSRAVSNTHIQARRETDFKQRLWHETKKDVQDLGVNQTRRTPAVNTQASNSEAPK